MSYPPPQDNHPPYGRPSVDQYAPHGHQTQPGFYGATQSFPPPQQHGQQFQGYPQQQQQSYMYGAGMPHSQQYIGGNPYGSDIPTPASSGYGPKHMPTAQEDAYVASVADALRKAMKGFGTDEAGLIHALSHFEARLIPHLKQIFQQRHSRSLEKDIRDETSSHFRLALLSILRGPLQEDVFLLDKALKGIGTNESLLNDVVIARSNADLNAVKHAYCTTYNRTLESAVSSDLSGKTQRLFSMILTATRKEESASAAPDIVNLQVMAIYRATEGKLGTEELEVCSILSSHSDGQLRAIALAYCAKFAMPLEKVLDNEFSGHMKVALIQMVRAASDRAMRDAELLEECMKGAGTKDEMLVSRIVRFHWDPYHMDQVRRAYKVKYGKDLIQRIKGETSGDYQRLLVAMVEPDPRQGSRPWS